MNRLIPTPPLSTESACVIHSFFSFPHRYVSPLPRDSSTTQLRIWPKGVTAVICQFLLPFLRPGSWRRESNSSSRKGEKPGRAGGAVLKIMEGTGSGLVSNSAAPSGRRGRNCGPLCPQGRNPLSSELSVHGVFVSCRQPEMAGRSKVTASCSTLSTTPGPFLSDPAPLLVQDSIQALVRIPDLAPIQSPRFHPQPPLPWSPYP